MVKRRRSNTKLFQCFSTIPNASSGASGESIKEEREVILGLGANGGIELEKDGGPTEMNDGVGGDMTVDKEISSLIMLSNLGIMGIVGDEAGSGIQEVRPLPDGFIDRESDLKKRKNNDRAYVEETAREPRSVDKWKMIVSICEELEILGGFTPGLSGDGNKEMKPHKGREESTEGAGAMLQKAQGEDIEGGEGRCNLFEKTGYAKLWEVDTVGLSGGLLLMWKDDLHMLLNITFRGNFLDISTGRRRELG
ncbi:hypothetical protein G4B88_018714 [Cannabis sativa]|uniref:Uncharacterized protein n=1 Tax=Cannabis sativa TaxID=3483 RepID=A0A7J6HYJ7_CANSA|nr:hypothetical protein G4B88_018714 [Cannabis sativa]